MRVRIKVDSGRYEFVQNGCWASIYQGGRILVGQMGASPAVLSMMHELDAARVVLQAARKLADRMATLPIPLVTQLAEHDEFVGLTRAIGQHSGLVDDREPPSPWTGVTE